MQPQENKPEQGIKIADAALRIPCTEDTFLKVFFDLLRPIHKLTPKEIEVAVCFVKHWYKLSNTVKDDKQLNQLLFSPQEKALICEELGLTPQHLRKILVKFRQRMIIVNGKLNYRYIRHYTEGKPFRLMFIIDNAETTRANNQQNV